MNKRILIFIIFLLIALGIVYRISTPPRILVPGPIGDMPVWSSKTTIGEMTAQSLRSDENKWIGVWHDIEPNGTHVSAVWIFDLEKPSAKSVMMADDSEPIALGWKDRNTIRLLVRKHPINSPVYNELIHISARDAKISNKEKIKNIIEAIYAMPEDKDYFFGKSKIDDSNIYIGLHNIDGTQDKTLSILDVNKYKDSTFSNVKINSDKSKACFILANKDKKRLAILDKSGQVLEIDIIEKLPGRIEDLWISDKGILILWVGIDKIGTNALLFDENPSISPSEPNNKEVPSTNTNNVKLSEKYNLSDFPTAPKTIKLVTYNGGYEVDLKTGKTKKLFSYEKLPRTEQYWRAEVQDGRLYDIKDGYISISTVSNNVDIRKLDKNGKRKYDILARK